MEIQETKQKKERILIVDDHPIVRQGLEILINQQPDLEVCGESETAADALKIIDELKPTLLIIDITLKDTSGIELVKNVRTRYPGMLMLVLSMHDETIYAERVLNAGARGYIMKQEATRNVVNAIRKVLEGGIYLSDNMVNRALKQFSDGRGDITTSPLSRLTDRELEVLELLGQGSSSREIAKKLHVSIKTVDTHRENIKDKLTLRNANELVQYAIHWVMEENRG